MATQSQNKKEKALSRTRCALEPTLRNFNPDHLALPQNEIRRLVVRSAIRYKIEPFVRQMMRVMDNLRAGRIRKVAKLTVSKRDESRAVLIAAIANAAREGRTMAAHETAFLAALYAYQNSVDHMSAFLSYLDGFRKLASGSQMRKRRRS
jgi:hypothetical protein